MTIRGRSLHLHIHCSVNPWQRLGGIGGGGRAAPTPEQSSVPQADMLKNVGGGGRKGLLIVSTCTQCVSGTFITFFFFHNQDNEAFFL